MEQKFIDAWEIFECVGDEWESDSFVAFSITGKLFSTRDLCQAKSDARFEVVLEEWWWVDFGVGSLARFEVRRVMVWEKNNKNISHPLFRLSRGSLTYTRFEQATWLTEVVVESN